MKYLFLPSDEKSPATTHKRTSDGVFGQFVEFAETATIIGDQSKLLSSKEGFDVVVKPVITPPAPTVVVPQSLSNWWAKAAIELAGLTAAVEAAMQSLDEPACTVALSAWENGADLDRRGATVLALAAALGLTDAQVDTLFVTGGSLTV